MQRYSIENGFMVVRTEATLRCQEPTEDSGRVEMWTTDKSRQSNQTGRVVYLVSYFHGDTAQYWNVFQNYKSAKESFDYLVKIHSKKHENS